jgi:hypothetical protein
MKQVHRNYIYVLDKDGNPLMPTERRKMVFNLLDSKMAKVVRREPFTIKLLFETTNFVQDLYLGEDVGSKVAGYAVVGNGRCYYSSEVNLRNDISKKMKDRAMYRKDRRNRNTRYRPARFDNRGNSKKEDRIPPTIKSKFDSHEEEKNFIKSILPIKQVISETAQFDNHKIANPEVWGTGYQKGINYGYANSREHALHRDGYTCQVCKKSKCRLEVHHILERSKGGCDDVDNLITLCKDCHDKVHNKEIDLKKKGKKKTQVHATQMNIICSMIRKKHPDLIETYGYITKANRQALGLPKMHCMDALVIASGGKETEVPKYIYKKRCVAKGTRQMIKFRNKGYDKFERKVHGHYTHEKAEYFGKVGVKTRWWLRHYNRKSTVCFNKRSFS